MRIEQKRRFITHDGIELLYRHWPAHASNKTKQAVLLFHQGLEHGGRMAHLVEELDLPNCDFFAWDARGHGASQGSRGDSPSFATSVLDVQYFVSHISQQHNVQIEDMAVLAQGMGAMLTATWAHDFAPKIRALVLASPTFRLRLYFPFAHSLLKLLYRCRGNFLLKNHLNARLISHDHARIASFNQDPLVGRTLSIRLLLEMHETAKRVVADAEVIYTPTQLLISGSDWLAQRAPQEDFFTRLGSLHKEKHLLPGFFHDIFGESARKHILQRVRRFLAHQFERRIDRRHSLLTADICGPSCAEAESISAPLPPTSIKALYWQGLRVMWYIGSKLSDGIHLAFDSGFNSASTLDYVYRNRASGKGALGRWVDHQYLEAIGGRGIHQRKLHIEELMKCAIDQLRAADTLVRIVDIAAGHGRYILDAVASLPQRPDSVLLRDYSDFNVKQGRVLITRKGLDDLVEFVQGDAFNRIDLALLNPKPTLVVVSGLYELFADNQKVRESLAGLAAAVEKGGWLLYTNQPWHPRQELIARTLTCQQDGKPWVMRRRSQAEMDQLVNAAGFRKKTQRIDPWGIFTVSLAQRIS